MVSVSLCAELPESFQSVESVALHATEPLGGLQTGVCCPFALCTGSSWDTFKLWCLQGSRPAGDQLLSQAMVSIAQLL